MIQLTFYVYIPPVSFHKHTDIGQSESHTCDIFFKTNPPTIQRKRIKISLTGFSF